MSRKKSMFNRGDKLLLDRNVQYTRLYSYFSLLAKARFKWSNLPNGMKSEYIENALYEHGQAGFYNDDTLGFICLPCHGVNGLNVYNEHKEFNIYGVNYNKIVKSNDMVLIKANDDSHPIQSNIIYYTDLMEEIERTILINLNQQKIPKIVPTTNDTKLTMKNLMEQVENGELAVYVDSKLVHGVLSDMKSIDISSPFLLDKLQKAKNDTMQEIQTMLGYNNTLDKKERLLVDEVNVNNNIIQLNLELEYKNRVRACEEINRKYGLNIKVEKLIDTLDIDFMGQTKDNNNQD